jgi:hypothetical protein
MLASCCGARAPIHVLVFHGLAVLLASLLIQSWLSIER